MENIDRERAQPRAQTSRLSSQSNIFTVLKKRCNLKLPKEIQEILSECAFDNKSSIFEINDSACKLIEEFVTSNHSRFESILKNTKYENISPFKLLPGHKLLILSLPNHLQKVEKRKVTVKDEELPQVLLKKLHTFTEKSGFEIVATIDSISEFRKEGSVYKCKFECPVCDRKISCQYKTNWLISNLQAHIKGHLKEIKSSQINSTEDPTKNLAKNSTYNIEDIVVDNANSNAIEIVSLNKQQEYDISNILGA